MIEEMFAVFKEMAARSTDYKLEKNPEEPSDERSQRSTMKKGGTRRKTKTFGCAITWQQKEGRKSGRTLGETLPWLSAGRRRRKRRRDQEMESQEKGRSISGWQMRKAKRRKFESWRRREFEARSSVKSVKKKLKIRRTLKSESAEHDSILDNDLWIIAVWLFRLCCVVIHLDAVRQTDLNAFSSSSFPLSLESVWRSFGEPLHVNPTPFRI